MGNCIETCNQSWRRDHYIGSAVAKAIRFDEDDPGKVHIEDSSKGVMRVKIVLTREELEWMMVQLSGRGKGGAGKRSLEEVLEEIERGRSLMPPSSSISSRTPTWRPSLESILEVPEVHDHMDRS